jgi:hypothetical protein
VAVNVPVGELVIVTVIETVPVTTGLFVVAEVVDPVMIENVEVVLAELRKVVEDVTE